jgi:hypothetical protein
MKDLSKVRSVKTLNLGKGDVLVVEVNEDGATTDAIGRLREFFKKHFPKNETMIHYGLKLSVVKQEKKVARKTK